MFHVKQNHISAFLVLAGTPLDTLYCNEAATHNKDMRFQISPLINI